MTLVTLSEILNLWQAALIIGFFQTGVSALTGFYALKWAHANL